MNTTYSKILASIYQNPKFRGSFVIVVGKDVYSTKSGTKKSEILAKVIKKYPKETPLVTYVPKEDTLILILK